MGNCIINRVSNLSGIEGQISNLELNKQDTLIAGNGIKIDSSNNISNVFTKLSNVDLNDIKYNFQGYVTSATNQPSGYASGNLLVYGREDQLSCEQIFTPYNSAIPVFVRNYATSGGSGSWTAWKKISDCYEAGDTINLGNFDCLGHSASATQFVFSIPINKPIAASNVTFNKLQVTVYSQDGRLINNVDFVADSSFTITTASINNNGINVLITKNESFIENYWRPLIVRISDQTSITLS